MAMENDVATQINEQTICICGRIVTMRTAWTENYLRRRFLGCSYYGRPDACDYFKWMDPLVHPRYKSVINGLLQNANREVVLEKKLQQIVLYYRDCVGNDCVCGFGSIRIVMRWELKLWVCLLIILVFLVQ
ncbi:GRF-type domain-containing protein [Forsythia ovata]|uniref:GRF-type domain-containing protein n=1 Tax=Forsythia ovata TaxID=205694 RepID=A0ABD1RNU9_9LAMI